MSFDVSPLSGSIPPASAVDRVRPAPDASPTPFADALAGGGTPPIPDEVWDQVDAAHRLAEELHAQGREVRFDVHKLNGDVVAALVDVDRGLLRPLLLTDVVDVGRLSRELGQED
jgi:hypothetical protein